MCACVIFPFVPIRQNKISIQLIHILFFKLMSKKKNNQVSARILNFVGRGSVETRFVIILEHPPLPNRNSLHTRAASKLPIEFGDGRHSRDRRNTTVSYRLPKIPKRKIIHVGTFVL